MSNNKDVNKNFKNKFNIIFVFIANIAAESIPDFSLSFIFSEGFGPEAGYVAFMGLPRLDMRLYYKSIIYIELFENIVNSMGVFSAYGLGIGIVILFINIEVSYCWASAGNAYAYPVFIWNSYNSLNIYIGTFLNINNFTRLHFDFGPSFIYSPISYSRLNELFCPIFGQLWNVRIGFEFLSYNKQKDESGN